jgi:beta-glucosidase
LNFEPQHPASGDPDDAIAAAEMHDRVNRWYLDPIVGRGYPSSGASALAWLDETLEDDLTTIAQPIDFLGVNYYSRSLVRAPALPPLPVPDVERTAMGWEVYPEGLGETLRFVVSRTGALPLYVTENGAAFPLDPDPTRDPARVRYLRRHVAVAGAAIAEGVPLHGYFVWSLLDNFEWARGYAPRFGIVHVDYATQERRIRDSGRYWAALAARAASGVEPSSS